MSDGFVGIDPDAARAFAATLRGAAGTAERRRDRLAEVMAAFELDRDLSSARSHLLDLLEDAEAAAADFDARADLAEAIDDGDWAAVFTDLVPAVGRTEAAWEAETTGGPDEVASVPVTVSSWASVAARMTGGAYPLPGSLCASAAWYRQFGTLVGPDGQAYPLLVPQARDVEADADAPRWATDDWGPPDGPAVTDLLGRDPGWSTVAVERGAGRLGDDLSPLERLLAGLGGAPAANFLDANGLWPAGQDVYPGTTLDAEFNPNFVPVGDRPASAGPDAVDEIAGVTPVLVEEPSGNVRYELTVPSAPSAVVMGGAAELVSQVATGMGNVQQVEDARNLGFVVEYQVNDDGRTRAIVHTHHIEIDADGDPVVFVGYGGLTADGEPGVVQMVSPRVNGDYAPTYPTNGIEPD